MSDTKYAYAVARIRALENGLFSSAQIEQLLSVKSYEGALRFLTEHGWGDADTPLSAEAILTREKAKSWETVRDLLKGDDAILAVLSYGDLYHNLKAAIKDAAAPGSHGNVYFDDCEVDGVRMAKIVAEKDWQALPSVILIPGISGNTGKGVESVKNSVEQAVGSDILFGDA